MNSPSLVIIPAARLVRPHEWHTSPSFDTGIIFPALQQNYYQKFSTKEDLVLLTAKEIFTKTLQADQEQA